MALQTHGLSRRFGDRLAVDNASFSVERGRLTGFVGANGAGKTTVMRMILGVLAPSAGTVTLDGIELDQATRRSFGYMPEERGLYPKMPLREQMVYFAMLHGLSKTEATAASDRLLETLDLTERAKDPIENLSLGNQQRAQVAVSLVHQPTALILDEPFSGLDPMAVDVILSVLTQHAERGIPLMLSSHQLDVVERLCDDLVIISGGKILAAGSIEGLRQEYSKNMYALSAPHDLSWLAAVPGVTQADVVAVEGNWERPASQSVTLTLSGSDDEQQTLLRRIIADLVARGPLISVGPVNTPLTEIFRDVVAGTNHDAEESA
ncbi:ABC transporter ATP-binding protein [Actinomyces minihominis]|uniref:ABC transporter ATP-binding protein n=1 Tax=Actinomyces minihominis TaxID=2002838 RepID=UPI000C08B014|nr:ATP-binding cassette domain-containing protein [Actinomyces minihominis]